MGLNKELLPNIICADWSVNAKNRAAIGLFQQDANNWSLRFRDGIDDVDAWLKTWLDGQAQRTWLGIDVGLGLPEAWWQAVQAAGKPAPRSFRELLQSLSKDDPFFQRAQKLEELSLWRPFASIKDSKKQDLVKTLFGDSDKPNPLMRQCDREAKAEALFWCVGPRQVGGASAHAWKTIIKPFLDHEAMQLAFLDCTWAEASERLGLTIVEIWPTLARKSVAGKGFNGSKENRADRIASWAHLTQHAIAKGLNAEICYELGQLAIGSSHLFDAASGVLALEQAVRHPMKDATHNPREGSIFGLNGDRAKAKQAAPSD